MDQKILKQLDEINKKLDNVITKDDLDHALKNFITKDHLDHALKNFITKDHLDHALKNFITKDHLDQRLKKQAETICEDISETVNALFTETDKQKADRTELSEVAKRVTKLESRTKVN
jgi:hypothetical protein